MLGGGGAGARPRRERDRHGADRPRPGRAARPGTRPNPGRARDLAFILFTGEGERTRANRITNGRWALSAFATASAAALSDADTVYAVTPIYHPSGLLMSIGGAIAGGARLAIARDFDPATFWEEVRRYGITVASYTWTMLREIADRPRGPRRAPPPGAAVHRRRHAARALAPGRAAASPPRACSSSTPRPRARRSSSTSTGDKPGCKGRPLPGSAEVRLAAYDVAAGRLRERADGFAVACGPGEVGMLLTRLRGRGRDQREPAARRVRARRRLARDRRPVPRRRRRRPLARRPRRGADPHRRTATSPAFPIIDALGDLDAVDLAVVYGVADRAAPDVSLAIAAVTLRRGLRSSTPRRSPRRSRCCRRSERPDLVHVVDEIPVTTWYRPSTAALRADGVPAGDRRLAPRRRRLSAGAMSAGGPPGRG